MVCRQSGTLTISGVVWISLFPDCMLAYVLPFLSSSIPPSPFPRRRQWHPTPLLLPGKSHGWRSLVGCSPWGREESDITEQLHFHFSLSCIGEGNGNPLQCSCLENPRDREAWWAAIYGVAQSPTRLKRLSSSSSSSSSSTIFIDSLCICVLIYDLCFSLSDLLHSV